MLYFNVNVMGVKMTIKEYFMKMGRQKEVCKICGCTFENPCYTHENGTVIGLMMSIRSAAIAIMDIMKKDLMKYKL